MTYIDAFTLHNRLIAQGHKNVELVSQGVKLSCCLGTHKDKNPSAFVVLKDDQTFYKCFSCGVRLPLAVFLKRMDIEGDAIHEVTEHIPGIEQTVDTINHREVQTEAETQAEGDKLFREAEDYRMFPKVVQYLQHRLKPDFVVPPNMGIRFHTGRKSLLLKGIENGVTERFTQASGKRFLNYGNACIFHGFKEEVEDLVLVEGFFDYLSVANAGFNAAALMTISMHTAKFRQLENIVKNKVYLMLDNDLAGYTGTQKIVTELNKRAIPYEIVDYEGKDPSDIGIDMIGEYLDKAGARRLFKHTKRVVPREP